MLPLQVRPPPGHGGWAVCGVHHGVDRHPQRHLPLCAHQEVCVRACWVTSVNGWVTGGAIARYDCVAWRARMYLCPLACAVAESRQLSCNSQAAASHRNTRICLPPPWCMMPAAR